MSGCPAVLAHTWTWTQQSGLDGTMVPRPKATRGCSNERCCLQAIACRPSQDPGMFVSHILACTGTESGLKHKEEQQPAQPLLGRRPHAALCQRACSRTNTPTSRILTA